MKSYLGPWCVAACGLAGTMFLAIACSSDPSAQPAADGGTTPVDGGGGPPTVGTQKPDDTPPGDDDDDDDDDVDAGNKLPPTTLPIDCRLKENNANPEKTHNLRCRVYQGDPPVGAGPRKSQTGTWINGFFDTTRDVFFINSGKAIVKVDRTTGDRSIVTGVYEDPQTGPKKVGSGPEWTLNSIFFIRPEQTGKIFVMASEGIFVVDPADGARTLRRNYAGKPAENQIRIEGFFAVDNGTAGQESFYVALTRQSAGGGVGILKLPSNGAGEVVTLSGAVDTGRNKGGGVSYDVAGYNAVNFHNGRVFMVNGDDDNLMSVDLATGDRLIVSDSERKVGEDTDGYSHGIGSLAGGDLLIDKANNTAYAFSTKIDLANGNRSYLCPFFRPVGETARPENAIDVNGTLLHVDATKGIMYDLGDDFIRVIEPASGNFNYITREMH